LGKALEGADFKVQAVALVSVLLAGHLRQLDVDREYQSITKLVWSDKRDLERRADPRAQGPQLG
jgi:hypothetical protein